MIKHVRMNERDEQNLAELKEAMGLRADSEAIRASVKIAMGVFKK